MIKFRILVLGVILLDLLACATVYRTDVGKSSIRSNALEYDIALTVALAKLRFPETNGFALVNPVFDESKFSTWLIRNKDTFNKILSQMDLKQRIFININTADGVEQDVLLKYCNEIGKKIINGINKGGLPSNRFVTRCRGAEETIPSIDPKSNLNNRATFAVGSIDETYEERALMHKEKVKYSFGQKENVSVVVEGHVEVTGSLDFLGSNELKLIYGCTGYINANEPIRYESKTLDLTVSKKNLTILSIDANKEFTKLECTMRLYDEDGFSRSEKETLVEFSQGMGGYVKELQDPPKGLDFFKSKVAPWIPLVPIFLKVFDLIDPNDSGDIVSIELLKERGFAPTIYQVTEPDKSVKPIRLWFTVNVMNTDFNNPAP